MIATVLAAAVTVYGVAGALASLLQRRRMRKRGSSQDVSLAYLTVIAGGYVLWLAYGLAIGNLPLIVADAVGGGAILATICVALRLRHGWLGCLRSLRATRRRNRPLGDHRRPRLGDRGLTVGAHVTRFPARSDERGTPARAGSGRSIISSESADSKEERTWRIESEWSSRV